MKPSELFDEVIKGEEYFFQKERGRLMCALERLKDYEEKFDKYFQYLDFDGSEIKCTTEHWIDKIDDYLDVTDNTEDNFVKALESYGNIWNGSLEDIGDKWKSPNIGKPTIASKIKHIEWQDSMWYLINMPRNQEDRDEKSDERISKWKEDKRIIFKYHYQKLLHKIKKEIISGKSGAINGAKGGDGKSSIDKYKVSFLLYTKIRSFGWSHNDIKPWYAEFAVKLIEGIEKGGESDIPYHWKDWVECPLKIANHLMNDKAKLASAMEVLEKYYQSLLEHFQEHGLQLNRSISLTGAKEHIGTAKGKRTSCFNTRTKFGIDEDKLNLMIEEVESLLGSVVDDVHREEFGHFKTQKVAYWA